ncbi:MAG: HEAT repeat domain-containing protein [Nostocaceae cyanobacterium]|nr:HEAT repeat domain-containing protein [Nostocaceae cyanobacterium]
MTVVNFKPYLESICKKYAQWWDVYTLTDVVGKKRDEQKKPLPLLHNLMVETLKREKESWGEQEEKTEKLTVLEGLRKYALNHVLLIGRPGSGKSTALVRLLLESSQKERETGFLNPKLGFYRLTSLRNPVSDIGVSSQFQRTSDMSQGINSLAISGDNAPIPVLVELRYYQTSILDLIRDFLKRHQILLSTCEIEQLLLQGQFLLLVDGVNELPSEAARQDLQKFRQDYRNTTPMVFTTRDLGVGGDLGIEKKLQMQPLTEEQMREFVCRYLPEQGEEMLKQLSGRLRELGETPLLLLMLCSVFVDNRNQVPANLGSVFRRFTEIYDDKLKQDIPVTDESRRWWKRLLQHLAWVMTHGGTSPADCRDAKLPCGNAKRERVSTEVLGFSTTEILVAIPKQQARDILTQFLKQQDYHQPRDAEVWLDDLLKHHLIQIGTDNQIEFRHQLLQEYYAAERLLQELPKLSDEQLQWDYLNYLKWTEPVTLMMQLLDVETQNLRVVKLALKVDWQLGARLAGEVKPEFQKETVKLITDFNLPEFLSIRLLRISQSEAAIPGLIKLLEHQDSSVRRRAASTLGEIKSEAAIPGLIKLLEYQDLDVRFRAAYALGEIKSEAAIPGLIKLLEHQDSDVRFRAAYALEKIKSEAAIPGLIKLLEHQDSDVRYSAAYALREIKSEAAIPGLIKLLEHQDSHLHFRAASALREIKSEAAIPGLIKLLEHQDSDVRRSAAYALREIKSEAAIPGLIKLLEHQDSDVRRSAASVLLKIKLEAAVPGLIKLLEDEESYVRYRVAYALGEIKSEAAVPGLIKLLEDEDYDVLYSTVDALGKIKSEAAVTRLIKLLEHQESYVRYSAADALGEIKSEAAIPGLIKLLEDQDSSVRYSAADALGEIKSEAAIPGLIKLLEDQDSSVRYCVAFALEKIKSEAAIPGLIKLLEHQDSHVRSRAASALGEIKSEAAIPGLIKLLEDQDYSVRYCVAFALEKIKSEAAIPGLIKLLEHQDSDVRSRAAYALGKIKSEAAIPGLIQLLEHQDSDVRYRAAYALGKIKSEAAIPGLIKLLEHQDSDVRSSAAYALGEIKSEPAIPGLIKLLEHQDFFVRSRAASALGEIKSEAAIPGLIKLLEDQDSHVRSRAASALVEIKSEAAIPGLIKLLEHQDFFVHYSAADALGKIKSEAAIPELIKLLKNKNFLNLNNGENASQTINALAKIQEHFKYYKPIPKPTMSKSTSHNYALLIGVGELPEFAQKYQLPVVVKDIKAIAYLLTDPKFCGYINDENHTRLLLNTDATSQGILDALQFLKQQAENDPEATILIYYSGHGFLDDSGDYYLIPYETDQEEIIETALPANTFKQALREIPAKRLLVIIDCCHAQGMASSKDGKTQIKAPKGFTQTALSKTIIDDLKQGTGRVVFTSSTGKQLSWIRRDDTMSIYTYHFLEALQGAGNQPGDKVVKVSHLMNYLGKTVPASTQQECQAEQTPFFDFATEDFPIALLRGGKGLPQQEPEELKREAQEKIRGISDNVSNNISNSDVGNIISITAESVNVGGISSTKGGH